MKSFRKDQIRPANAPSNIVMPAAKVTPILQVVDPKNGYSKVHNVRSCGNRNRTTNFDFVGVAG